MLQVVKFIEGGFDLTTNKEVSMGIVVSNGLNEVLVPVSESSLRQLVHLYGEDRSNTKADEPEVERPPVPRPSPRPAPAPRIRAEQVQLFENPPSPRIEDTVELPPEDAEAAGFEPGEEYSDTGTGVASL
jgi:hypothetical protein